MFLHVMLIKQSSCIL